MTTGVEGGPSPRNAQSATVPFSLDCQGGTDTQTTRAKATPRYVYYRLYANDGPLDSYNPIYCNNSSISRILSKSVPPPRTAASLKRYLCRIEGFEEPDNCALCLSLSEKAALEDSTALPLREDPGPGSRESDPMVLVVNVPAGGKRSPTASMVQPTQRRDDEEPRYVYYRVYDENAEIISKTSFDETDMSLGRIYTLSVPPPRTVASLKCCLLKAEEIIDAHDIQLFEDEDSNAAMDDGDAIALDADTYPGVIEDKPMAIVRKAQKTTLQSATFSKRLTAIGRSDWGDGGKNPGWHSYEVGDIFQTDGILLISPDEHARKCYAAVNSSGKKAFVHQWLVIFI